jgi:hypothetical protein
VLASPVEFLRYLTPLPAVIEVLSWDSSLGHDSAVAIHFEAVTLSRLHIALLFQLACAAAAALLRYAPRARC